MSYQSLFGAFPIALEGSSLTPKPDALVGELRGSSRNGAFFRGLGDLLNALPSHDVLRFFADEPNSSGQQSSDGILWTILDSKSTSRVIATLDSLLRSCDESAAVAIHAEFFQDHGTTAAQLRGYLLAAKECSDVNVQTPSDEGDDIEFLFAALVSLRGLLRRAQAHAERIAVFTWSPRSE